MASTNVCVAIMYRKQHRHAVRLHNAKSFWLIRMAWAVQGIPLVLVPVIRALGVGCTHDDQLVDEAAMGVGYQPGDDSAPVMCY